MKAAWVESFGSAQDTIVLGEQDKPTAGPSEVLVKLKTTGVNPSDVKKHAGARVIATVSNSADEAACKLVGADFVVNHRQDDWADQVLSCTGGEKVECVIDVEFGANLPQVLKFIATGGVIATYSSTQVKEPQLPLVQMMFMDLTCVW